MVPSTVTSLYHITTATMLNFNSGNYGHRLKTLHENRPFYTFYFWEPYVGAPNHLEWYVYFKFRYIYDRVILINAKFLDRHYTPNNNSRSTY